MIVIVNERASGGKGAARWKRIAPELGERYAVRVTESVDEGRRAVDQAIADGREAVIAAGGDGTVNGVLNALMDPATDRPRADIALGAIGLGSSNDFHKPLARDRTLVRIPVRLRREQAAEVDVGKAVLTSPEGEVSTRYFVLNGGVGLVAEGNAFFNAGDRIVRALKRVNTELAILYAALVNIVRHRPVEVSLRLDGEEAEPVALANLGILKKVHFAGGMRYDTPVQADDGQFDVNLWLPMSRFGLIGTIAGLYRGKFTGRKNTRALRAQRVEIAAEAPLFLELDGEVDRVSRAELTVLPRALRVLG